MPYPTFLTISGFQAATLAALSASNGWAARNGALGEPFSPLSESQWISCLSSWLRHQLDRRIEPEMLCHTEKKAGRHGSEWVGCEGGQGQGCARAESCMPTSKVMAFMLCVAEALRVDACTSAWKPKPSE